MELITKSIDDLAKVVNFVAKMAVTPCLILLSGNLGFGKTTLTKKLFAHYGVKESEVKSPTYSLINSFSSQSFDLNHLDLYRLENHDPYLMEEIKELINKKNSITVIEWPEKIDFSELEHQDINIIKIKLEKLENDFRKVTIHVKN
ncbi:tRNA (adenosine(37)-N6)-threonylcarbamoyltransferase complex ATPase subunit type 1 TsaE [Candidatus Peregrinibacteria bacterium]|nr:tRNA (adenosine(37)-N6)-threonylcarbamoyltransferase complex ATPase subunit type 1 TsaE [Candidatus Peregrinibacteria bacterium]